MIMISLKTVLADLNSQVSRIEMESSEPTFYLKIANYGKYLLDHSQINPIIRPLYDEAERDASDYVQKWTIFINQWKHLANDLVELAKKEQIKDDPNDIIHLDIVRLTQKLSKPEMLLWSSDLSDYYIPYRSLVGRFVDADKKDLVVDKYLDSGLVTLTIDTTYHEAVSSWDRYKKLREIKPWWAHYQIMRLTSGALGLENQGQYFKDDNIVDALYKYEFEKVSSGSGETFVLLKKKKYLEWIRTLHDYIAPRIQEVEESSKKPATDYESPLVSPLNILTKEDKIKRWGVLQAIWLSYESFSRPDTVMVPLDRLSTDSKSFEEFDRIVEGLKRDGCFETWGRNDRYYAIEHVSHTILPQVYTQIKPIAEVGTAPTEGALGEDNIGSRPYCVVESGVGHLKFGKFGKKNKIGGSKTRPFRLLQALTEPFGTAKTVDTVFEAIRLPKDGRDQRLLDSYRSHNRKVEIIEFATKELQKSHKLGGKLKIRFDDGKTMVWMEATN